MDMLKTREALTDYNGNPFFYVKLLTKKYGKDWIKWDPVTIELTLRKDFNIDDIPDDVIDAISALLTLFNSNIAFVEPNAFEKVAIALNTPPVDFTKTYSPTPAQIAKAVYVMRKIRPKQQFNKEVQRYIAFHCWKNGMFYIDEPIDMSQDELEYILKDRGTYNKDDIDYIKEIWGKLKDLPMSKLENLKLREDKFNVMLLRLLTIREAVKEISE